MEYPECRRSVPAEYDSIPRRIEVDCEGRSMSMGVALCSDLIDPPYTFHRPAEPESRSRGNQQHRLPGVTDDDPTLDRLARDFSSGIKAVDATKPVWRSARTGNAYQAGAGPLPETETVRQVAEELARRSPTLYGTYSLGVPYPSSPRQRRDWVTGEPPALAIEVKMLRLMGNNGKPNDNMLMHILSPYAAHRSALTDTEKLVNSGFSSTCIVLIYGFDYPSWPLDPAIDASERLAGNLVTLSDRAEADFDGLVHPIHRAGRVFAWGVTANR